MAPASRKSAHAALVGDLAASHAEATHINETPTHVEGPYYRPGAPEKCDLYPDDSNGPVLHFGGRVTDTDEIPLANITVEVWHADERGRYDNDDPANLPKLDFFRCRGKLATGADGTFGLRTVLPANYKVDPEGKWIRVKHLHFKVYALGFLPLTTEIDLLPDPYIGGDTLFDMRLSAQLEPMPKEKGLDAFRTFYNFAISRITPIGYALAASRQLPRES